ncbi:MAG: ATP synthase F1 subunit delta [Planctomycetota bacterium]|nr:ATP synthase F1 subunit delta [Planctomycetota bacterium]
MVDQQEVRTRPPHVLEDPSSQAVARVYAEAFLGAAVSVGVDAALEELSSLLDDVFALHPEFERLLMSSIASREEKLGIIDRAIVPNSSEFFSNFLRVLAQHDRLELLPLILDQSQRRHEEQTGRRRVQVRTSRPLTEAQQQQVANSLAGSLPFQPILETSVDESLLGGLVIQIGDTVHDGSLKTRMKQLRDSLRKRTLHEIQSGRDRFSHPEGD